MQDNKMNESMLDELRKKLEWYTLYASDEEYDGQAVESISYLLDRWEPLEESVIPNVDEARERFWKIAEGEEFLPVEDAAAGETLHGGAAFPGNLDLFCSKKHARGRNFAKITEFTYRHKIVAAVAVVLVVLMLGNTIHAVANPEEGFFFWMKRDDSGIEMITSPEGLDNTTSKQENIYYNKDDVPEWVKEWIRIESEVEIPESYTWKYLEANELDTRQYAISYYVNETTKKGIVFGIWIYLDKISYLREGFIGYGYVQSYEISQKQVDVYKRVEDNGTFSYIVCFYDGNCKYYVGGQDNLEELKVLIEKYWCCVQK